MSLRTVCFVLALPAGLACAQDSTPIRALGTFDQIAVECARDGSDAEADAYRLKLWRAYLGAAEGGRTDQDIRDMMASLHRQIFDDASNELRRQYKAARAAIPAARSLGDADQSEFYRLCESPQVRGLPDRR